MKRRGMIDPHTVKQWLQGKTIEKTVYHQTNLLQLRLNDGAVLYIHTLAISYRPPEVKA